MSGDDYDSVFGRRAPRPGFVDRVGRGQPSGRPDPIDTLIEEVAIEQATPGIYKAFGHVPAGTPNPSCEVRSWMDGTDIADGIVFFYRLLLQIGFTADHELKLMLPDTIVLITGRHLDPLRQALTRQHATYIQQYSRRVWMTPPLSGELMVERIEILRP